MINNPKISIIVPVYNVEQYLLKCLNSLKFQTYSNLEIICVNDGSTDNSLEILNEFAKTEPRMKIYSQKNGGLSVARNSGLSIATGEYISFIDSDDWVYLTLYQTFVDFLQDGKSPDIWMFNASAYVKGSNDVVTRKFFDATDWVNHTSDDVEHTFNDCKSPFLRNVSVANKLYKKQFLDDLNLRFEVGLRYEDQVFSSIAFLRAKSIMFTEDIFYRYRNNHKSSIMLDVSEHVFDIFDVVDLVEDEIIKLGVYETYKYVLFQYKFFSYFQRYNFCPKNLKQQYFETMKGRLLAAELKGLNPQIASRLSGYDIFKTIKFFGFNDFEELINGQKI